MLFAGFFSHLHRKDNFLQNKTFPSKEIFWYFSHARLGWDYGLDLNINCLEVPSGSKRPEHWTLPFSKCFLKNYHLHSYSECPDGSAQTKLNILLEKKKTLFSPAFWWVSNKTLCIIIHPPPPFAQLGKTKLFKRAHLLNLTGRAENWMPSSCLWVANVSVFLLGPSVTLARVCAKAIFPMQSKRHSDSA